MPERAVRSRRFDGPATRSLVESVLEEALPRRRRADWDLVESSARLSVMLAGEPVRPEEPAAVYRALDRYAPAHIQVRVYGVVPEALAAVRSVLALGSQADAWLMLERVGWYFDRKRAEELRDEAARHVALMKGRTP